MGVAPIPCVFYERHCNLEIHWLQEIHDYTKIYFAQRVKDNIFLPIGRSFNFIIKTEI